MHAKSAFVLDFQGRTIPADIPPGDYVVDFYRSEDSGYYVQILEGPCRGKVLFIPFPETVTFGGALCPQTA
jgi:hypothetical protein